MSVNVGNRGAGTSVPGPNTQAIAIPAAAGHGQVKVRFHFTSDFAQYWWAIDDVFLGNRICAPVTGALLTGDATDGRTGAPLNGTIITSVATPTETATTMPTPYDPRSATGFYHLFTAGTGKQQFTASHTGYATLKTTVTIVPGTVITQNFALRATRTRPWSCPTTSGTTSGTDATLRHGESSGCGALCRIGLRALLCFALRAWARGVAEIVSASV